MNNPFMITSPIYLDDESFKHDKNMSLEEADKLVKRNKLDQLNSFIGQINDDELKNSGIERSELLQTIETYYNIAEKNI